MLIRPQHIPLVALLCAQMALLTLANQAAAEAPETQHYELIVDGYFEGDGRARINAALKLHIQAKLVDEDGQKFNLNLPNIELQSTDRFTVTDTLDGKTFKLTGKVEPATEDSEARLTGTYIFDGDKVGRIVGRIVGSRKGKPN